MPNLTWLIPVKTGNLQVFYHRISNISAGQAVHTPRQAIKRNRQGGYNNRQARKYVGQDSFILPTHVLVVMGSLSI